MKGTAWQWNVSSDLTLANKHFDYPNTYAYLNTHSKTNINFPQPNMAPLHRTKVNRTGMEDVVSFWEVSYCILMLFLSFFFF